jgi:hypothetical protein
VNLRDHDPRDTGDFKSEEQAEGRAEELKQRLEALQERLYAEGSRAVLVVLREWIRAARMEPFGTS